MVSSAINTELCIYFFSSAATTTIVPGTDEGNWKTLTDRKSNAFCCTPVRVDFFKIINNNIARNTKRNTSKI